MPYIDNLDFLNLNSIRNYPIKEGASRISDNEAFTLPNDLIVDLQLAATYDPSVEFFISKISNFSDTITIQISDIAGTIAGYFTINVANVTKYSSIYFSAADSYIEATGVLTVGSLDGLLEQPTGNYFFTSTATKLEARAVIPALKGINRVIFQNANGTTFEATGDITIVARTNLRFSNPEANKIVIDAGEDLGLNIDCGDVPPCIKTINTLPPDENGNFTLDFSDCVTLTPIPANTGLVIQDVCCKPCTGCNEIETLTNRLTTLESSLLALRNYFDSLNTLFNEYKTTVTYTCDCPP